MFMFVSLIIAPALLLAQPPLLPQSDRPLEEQFRVPAADARILPIQHMLPPEPDKQDAVLDQMAARGFGGMAVNVSFKDYMQSEELWEGFLRAVRRAKDMGMSLWLYDERGYPSGLAGGQVLQDHPEWEAWGLMVAQTTSAGGAVSLACPPGQLFLAAAWPEADGALQLDGAVDLRDSIQEQQLNWTAPEGAWRVMAITEGPLYEGTHAAVSLADKLPYINLLMPEPTRRFLEVTHDAYAARLGADLGQYFVSTFTDEPSLMSMYFKPQPWSVLPWSPNLAAAFESRCGYALAPVVPLLACGDSDQARKVRFDFWMTVGDLVSTHYFGQIRAWCDRHNLLSGGHLLCEEPILTHVPLYGNFFQCLRQLSAPSMDCLTSIPGEVNWQVGRLISSAADLCGYTATMSESSDHSQHWRAPGDNRPKQQVTLEQMRGSFNRLMVSGITTFTSYYSFAGISDEECVQLNEWVGRCCTLIRGGKQRSEIAVVYPAESLAARYVASRQWARDASPEAHQIQRFYEVVSESLFMAGRDFTYVDGQALADAQVHAGRLELNGLSWRVIILPGVDTLPLAAWEKLLAFWQSGGGVIAVGSRPANSDRAFPDARVRAMADEILGAAPETLLNRNASGGTGLWLQAGQESLINRAADALAPPPLRIPANAPLRTTHRRIGEHEALFIINDSASPWSGEIGVVGLESGTCWRPDTGEHADIGSPDKLPLDLGPYGGVILRFERYTPQPSAAPALENVAQLNAQPLPTTTPTIGRGEYVAEQLHADDTSGRWTPVAAIQETDKDTFLFLIFSWAEPISLADRELMVFDVSVPTNQTCPQSLLILLRDQQGVTYYADTHRMLNTPGDFQVCIPINRFVRAPWSEGPVGTLDMARISAVQIGWGGYMGRAGEEVAYTTSAPRVL